MGDILAAIAGWFVTTDKRGFKAILKISLLISIVSFMAWTFSDWLSYQSINKATLLINFQTSLIVFFAVFSLMGLREYFSKE